MLSPKGSHESLHSVSLESDPSDTSSLIDEDYDLVSKELLSENDFSSSEHTSSDEENVSSSYLGLVYPTSQVGNDSVYSDQTLQMSLSAVSESIKSSSLASSEQSSDLPLPSENDFFPVQFQDDAKRTVSSLADDSGTLYLVKPDEAIKILYLGNMKNLHPIINKIRSSLSEFRFFRCIDKVFLNYDDEFINVIVLTNPVKEPQINFSEKSTLPQVHIVKGFLSGPRDKLNIHCEVSASHSSSTSSMPIAVSSLEFVPDLVIASETLDFPVNMREHVLGFAHDHSIPLLYIGEAPLSSHSPLLEIASHQFMKNNVIPSGDCRAVQSCITLESFQNLDGVGLGESLSNAFGKYRNQKFTKVETAIRAFSHIILGVVLLILLLANMGKLFSKYQGPVLLNPLSFPAIEDLNEYTPTLVFHQEDSAITMECPKQIPLCARQQLKTLWLLDDKVIYRQDIEPFARPVVWKFVVPEEWKHSVLRFKIYSQFAPFIRGHLSIDFRKYEANKRARHSKISIVSTPLAIDSNSNVPQHWPKGQRAQVNEQSIKQQGKTTTFKTFIDQVISLVKDHPELHVNLLVPQTLFSLKGFVSVQRLFKRLPKSPNFESIGREIEKVLKLAAKQATHILRDVETALDEVSQRYRSITAARFPTELGNGVHISENIKNTWSHILMVESRNLKIAQRQAVFLKKQVLRRLAVSFGKLRSRDKHF